MIVVTADYAGSKPVTKPASKAEDQKKKSGK